MNVTICPAVSDNPKLHFDKVQFASSRSQPVEVHYVGLNNGENGWASTGLSFGDYGHMQTQKRGRTERRLPTPAFMLDQARFTRVVIRFLENRVQLSGEPSGTEAERVQRLEPMLKRRAEQAMANLDRFCVMYVAATDDTERKRCQRRIEEFDTTIRICREPWIIPQMARAYYFEGLRSTAVGQRVGFKAPHVRQLLYRLSRLDAEMQSGRSRRTGRPEVREARILARAHAALGTFNAQNLLVGARQDAGNQSQHVSAS
jgi:hypothetical protein